MNESDRFSDGRPVPENPGIDTVLHLDDVYELPGQVRMDLGPKLSATITQVVQEARDYIATSRMAS